MGKITKLLYYQSRVQKNRLPIVSKYLPQFINHEGNVTEHKSSGQHLPQLIKAKIRSYHFCGILASTVYRQSNHKKRSDKPTLMDL